jgi:hypothetical protein
MADISEVIKVFAIMSLAWPNYKAKDGTIEVYASMLEDIPPDVLVAAARTLIASGGEFFPSVSAWRQTALDIILNKSGTPTAIEAWEEAVRECNRCGDYWRYQEGKKYPEYSHPLITSCVSAIGYAQILETENVDIVRAHFLKAYESLRQRRDIDQRTLPDVKQVEQKYIASGIKQLAEGMSK